MLLKIGSGLIKHFSAGQHFALDVWGEQSRKETPGEVGEKLCLVLDLPVLQETIFKAI